MKVPRPSCFTPTYANKYAIQEEFHAHNYEVDLEDFCAIMERHQSESLIVINQKKLGDVYERSVNDVDESTGNIGEDRGEERKGTKGAVRSAVGIGSGDGGTVGDGKIIASREDVISNLSEVFKEVREEME